MSAECPECGSERQYNSDYCKKCGFVFDECPFENDVFLPDSVKNKATLPELSVAESMPVHGKVIKDYWLRSTKEKNLFKIKKELERISSKLKLPEYIEKDSYVLFNRAVEKKINVGRDNLHILYACVYASCLMNNIPKTPIEMVAFVGADKNKMLKDYRLLKSSLDLKVYIMDPLDLVPRFCSRLRLKPSTISLVSEIIINLKGSLIIAGKHPKTIVASAIYLATKQNGDYRTQRDIANATGVLEVTIRKRCQEINLLHY